MVNPRVKEAIKKGYKPSKAKTIKCAVCSGKAEVLRKQIKVKGVWGFNSVILCSCGNESVSFYPLRKQPETVVL